MSKYKFLNLIIVLILFASGCTPAASNPAPASNDPPVLKVSGGTEPKAFSRPDLEKMTSAKASFKDVSYIGVPLKILLQEAGFDPAAVKAVKAVANDGFTVNYDASSFLREDMLVAYAADAGPLSEQDGAFRIVLPGAEGKLNPRMLVELQVIQ